MKKIISLFLMCTILVLSLNSVAFAAEVETPVVTPRWANISSITGELVVINEDEGIFSAFIDGYTNVTRITASANLYFLNSSNRWVEMPRDWEYDVYATELFIDETFSASSDYQYKVVVSIDVYAGNNVESVVRTFTT